MIDLKKPSPRPSDMPDKKALNKAKPKPSKPDEEPGRERATVRFELVMTPSLMARLEKQAARRQESVAVYLRGAALERLVREE